MRYHVMHWTGETESDYPPQRFGERLDELAFAEREHPDVAIVHESEWSLTILRSGFVVWEHPDEGGPKHLGPLDAPTILRLMVKVADGRISDLNSEAWRSGYP